MTFERSGAGRAFACAPRSKHKNETHQLYCRYFLRQNVNHRLSPSTMPLLHTSQDGHDNVAADDT